MEMLSDVQMLVESKYEVAKHMDVTRRLGEYAEFLKKHGINEITADSITEKEAEMLFGKSIMDCTLDEALRGIEATTEGLIKATAKAIVKFIKNLLDVLKNFFRDKTTEAERHARDIRKRVANMPPEWRRKLVGKEFETATIAGHTAVISHTNTMLDHLNKEYTKVVVAISEKPSPLVPFYSFSTPPIELSRGNTGNIMTADYHEDVNDVDIYVQLNLEILPFEELGLDNMEAMAVVFDKYQQLFGQLNRLQDSLRQSAVALSSSNNNIEQWALERMHQLVIGVNTILTEVNKVYSSLLRTKREITEALEAE
jgi:uncharacterized protein YerC